MSQSDDRALALLQGIWDEMKSLHLSLKKELAETRTELKKELAETRTELADTRRDLSRRIDQTNHRITELEIRIATELGEVSTGIKGTNELIRQWGDRLRKVESQVEGFR